MCILPEQNASDVEHGSTLKQLARLRAAGSKLIVKTRERFGRWKDAGQNRD